MKTAKFTVRRFGSYPAILDLPNRVEVQTKAWKEFLAVGPRPRNTRAPRRCSVRSS
jgi:hypothetical protein